MSDLPKLRMAPAETADELAHRCEREQRAMALQRESNLTNSLAPFRVGSVPYLNAVPLTHGVEKEILFAQPAKLAVMLREGKLDAALVSVTEVLFNDSYDVLDGVAVASLGEVKSVFLAHRRPIEEANEIWCDPASLTSINLLRVLMAEKGLNPSLKPLPASIDGCLPDYLLLIGNRALDFLGTNPQHEIWDLGAAWFELTHLPFVYAVWALRRGIPNEALRRQLREAKDFGLESLDYIIHSHSDYDYGLRRDYLGWHIHYHLAADEKRGLSRFAELLRKYGEQKVFDPHYVT